MRFLVPSWMFFFPRRIRRVATTIPKLSTKNLHFLLKELDELKRAFAQHLEEGQLSEVVLENFPNYSNTNGDFWDIW